MDLIFSNPGYHYIAQNICKYLNYSSLTFLSRASKRLLAQCNEAWLKKVKNYPNIQKLFEKAEQKLAEFIIDTDVEALIEFMLYELDLDLLGYITIPKLMQRSKEYDILLKILLDILEAIAKHGLKQIYDITQISHQLKTNINLSKPEKQISKNNIQICKNFIERDNSFLKVYGNFVPSQIPSKLRPQLMTILNFAIQMQNQKLILYMLRPLSEYDTCVSSLILAIATPVYRHLYNEEICDVEKLEEMNEIKFSHSKTDQLKHAKIVRRFARYCKNPNMPKNFGTTALHLASKVVLVEIVKVIIPVCNKQQIKKDRQLCKWLKKISIFL